MTYKDLFPWSRMESIREKRIRYCCLHRACSIWKLDLDSLSLHAPYCSQKERVSFVSVTRTYKDTILYRLEERQLRPRMAVLVMVTQQSYVPSNHLQGTQQQPHWHEDRCVPVAVSSISIHLLIQVTYLNQSKERSMPCRKEITAMVAITLLVAFRWLWTPRHAVPRQKRSAMNTCLPSAEIIVHLARSKARHTCNLEI
jgi:hypothetical protein